jgi:hypothetical protein
MNYQLKSRTVKTPIQSEFGIFEMETRYDICDMNGVVIDDAQGYGYKSAQSAHKATAYKFKGGKEKASAAKAFWRKNKNFADALSEMLMINFKDPPSNKEIVKFALEHGIEDFDPKMIKYLP